MGLNRIVISPKSQESIPFLKPVFPKDFIYCNVVTCSISNSLVGSLGKGEILLLLDAFILF